MKARVLIAFFSILVLVSCRKEIIAPVSQETELMNTRGGLRNPKEIGTDSGQNSGITDPDNESDEDKVKNRKKKAR